MSDKKKKNLKKLALKALIIIASLLAWLGIWKIVQLAVGLELLVPSPERTFSALIKLSLTKDFWITIAYSLMRIVLGFVLGVVLGVLLAIPYRLLPFTRSFLSIGMNVVKSTPVAVLILALWFIIGSKTVPIAIALMMVTPIVWQNTVNGFDAIDKGLSEVCDSYGFTHAKKFRYLILPTLYRHFFPALITSSGLAWKSGIAAEIITTTQKAIGNQISIAKSNDQTAEAFAWTIAIIVLSLSLEKIMQFFLKRGEKAWQ